MVDNGSFTSAYVTSYLTRKRTLLGVIIFIPKDAKPAKTSCKCDIPV